MRSKVTVVLIFLNVVLFYYIFQYEEKWKADLLTMEARKRVYGAEAASIETITRTGRDGSVLKLEKRGESWWLTKPYDWPANPNAVARVVNELQFLEHETSFAVADLAKSGQTLADYGLDHPALTLSFNSGGKNYVSLIGDDTKIGNRLYLLSPDGTRIHVVSRSLAESVGLPVEALRAESIFTVPVFEVRSLNVQTAALKVRLRRDATTHWAFETPILARASKSAVEVTINALNALTAKNFLEPAATDLERTGLNSPALRVTLEGNARRETLLLGNAVAAQTTPPADGTVATAEYYAKIDDKAVVFTVPVPQKLLEVLRSAQEDLRDPHVLDFEPRSVTALTLTAPGRPELTLQRLEAGSETAAWQVVVRVNGQAPQTTPADTAVVEELLKKLQFLSRVTFLSDAPSAKDLEVYGFNQPEREITLSLNTGGGPRGTDASQLTLQIGISPDKKNEAYARAVNPPYLYKILPDILEQAPVLARYYRQRLLRELPEAAKIQGLALTDLVANTPLYAKQFTDPAATWETVLAGESEARRKAIAVLVAQLRALKAKTFTADTFNPDHADTAQGPRPWRYRLDLNLAMPGGNGAAQLSTSTLFLTERIGGNTLLAGTAEFGGVEFEVSQELLDALFTLTYREKNDPGPTVGETTPPPAPAPTEPPAKP